MHQQNGLTGIGTGAIRPDFWENPIKFWAITDADYRRFLGVTANVLAPGGPAPVRGSIFPSRWPSRRIYGIGGKTSVA